MDHVSDRSTKATFSADWIFANSAMKLLKGKTITDQLTVRIINIDALLVMKIISCRPTDIRDVFMMLPHMKDKIWIRSEISRRSDVDERIAKVIEKVESQQFKDGLSGVYGRFDPQTFEKHRKALISLQ
ncbi:hypothetical protein HZB02_02110 [Candidatus Woesearchaeota archaeon]|nr:hypothetical protein [Candidatus Woesearchaeota archaeon]